jgi:hypothetical protein
VSGLFSKVCQFIEFPKIHEQFLVLEEVIVSGKSWYGSLKRERRCYGTPFDLIVQTQSRRVSATSDCTFSVRF